MVTLKARTYVNRDSSKVVPEGSVEAAWLLGNAGDEISEETAARLGLAGSVDEPAGYDAMKVPELRDLAAERGVDVPKDARKADLVAALEASDRERGGTADQAGAENVAQVESAKE